MRIEELTAEALRMDAASRAKMVRALIASLEDLTEEEVEALWEEEVLRRRDTMLNGTAQSSPIDEVFERLHARRK